MSMKNTHILQKRGYPLPLGVSLQEEGVNFAVFSRHAEKVWLEIGTRVGDDYVYDSFSLDPEINKTGDIWHVLLPLENHDVVYGYRFDGKNVDGQIFDKTKVLIDPYCQQLVSRSWGDKAKYGHLPVGKIINHDFHWQDDRPLKTPLSETIIYELHVRGFTQGDNSGVIAKGTYQGIVDKIDYLKDLGVTAIELMPITEFDENDNVFHHPESGELLKNFWGYNRISFFALKSGYAHQPENHINEFKMMVRALHQAGIEVILDMVYNHSGEGGYDGTTSSFRGIDNPIYYLLGPDKHDYLNFSGCGNTLNCNHPVVRELIRESLRFWVIEMHIDGFRFDLASILGRDQDGKVLPNPPMIEIIAEDPVLRDTKIIAEAWDAAGLYQVGTFSSDKRWAEWNGRFRDDVRAFSAGYEKSVTGLATRIAGSSDLYETSSRGPLSSINFITSHDGFTLRDLVSYEKKHNLDNGEENRDGDNHNTSWNSGHEGNNTDNNLVELRNRRMKSMATILFLSQGIPMLTAGDEFGRTQGGNNNAWCQDNEISWVDWSLAEKNSDLLRFFKGCIRLRGSHQVFRREDFFNQISLAEQDGQSLEISWQSLKVADQNWADDCHHLAFHLHGAKVDDDDFFVMLNGDREETVTFQVPLSPEGTKGESWLKIIDTAQLSPDDFAFQEEAMEVSGSGQIEVAPQAVVVLQALRR